MFWIAVILLVFSWMLIKLGVLSAMVGFFWIWIKLILLIFFVMMIAGTCVWIFKKIF